MVDIADYGSNNCSVNSAVFRLAKKEKEENCRKRKHGQRVRKTRNIKTKATLQLII